MPTTNIKTKGNKYDSATFHIPFFTEEFFQLKKKDSEPVKPDYTPVSIPILIDVKGPNDKTNIGYLKLKPIEHWEGNPERILETMSKIDTKVLPSKNSKTVKDEVKKRLTYLTSLCQSQAATATLEDAQKEARKEIVNFLYSELDRLNADEALQEKIMHSFSKTDSLYSLIEENKKRHSDSRFDDLVDITTNGAFEKYLFQAFEYHVWNHLNKIIFGQRHYEAYDDQKEYMTRQIIKPFGVSVELAFRRIDVMCLLLERFPPPGTRDGSPSIGEWMEHNYLKKVEPKEKRRMKFNLLPIKFQTHLQGLEQDWRIMDDAKFMAVAQEFERADSEAIKEAEKKRESLKRKNAAAAALDNDEGDRRKKDKRHKFKRDRGNKKGDPSGTARWCQLCANAGAPDWVCKTHNSNDCKKKGQYKRQQENLSNKSGLGSKQAQIMEMRKLQKQFQDTFKKAFKDFRDPKQEDSDEEDNDNISY